MLPDVSTDLRLLTDRWIEESQEDGATHCFDTVLGKPLVNSLQKKPSKDEPFHSQE